MYVVSEITGKRYKTVTECEVAEKQYLEQKKRAEDKEKREKLDKAWEKVVEAMDNFIEASEEVNSKSASEIKPLVELLRMF